MRANRTWLAAMAGAVALVVATILVLKAGKPADRSVAVYLTPWASEDDLLRVYTSVLGAPHQKRSGFRLKEGVAGVTRFGDEAQTILVVHFRKEIDRAARESLLVVFRASPLVTRVGPVDSQAIQ